MNPFKILKSLLPYLIEIVVAPLLRPIVERNLGRARVIEIVADAVAGQLVAEFPDAEWARLVQMAIQELAEELPPSVKTSNVDVLRRVAVAALEKRGVVKPAQ